VRCGGPLPLSVAVAEHGYAGTTVQDMLSRAQMSRRTFYQLFRNREECFLATYDAALAEAMERLALAHDGNGRRWHGQVEAALAALFEYLAAEPGLARVWLVEAPSLGAAGVERHERTMKQLPERLAGSGRRVREVHGTGRERCGSRRAWERFTWSCRRGCSRDGQRSSRSSPRTLSGWCAASSR
jgi:AcrR family transcriptional regulator